jgi:hypothetical protein
MTLPVSRLHSADYRMINECGTIGGMKIDRGNWGTQKKPLPSTTSFITNPTWSDLGLNMGRRGRNRETSHLIHGTARDVLLNIVYVGIGAGYGLEDRSSIPVRVKVFLFTASRRALGYTQPPIQWLPWAIYSGVMRPGRVADHLPP